MRNRRKRSPTWVLALAGGLLAGLACALVRVLLALAIEPDRLAANALSGFLYGLMFGLVMIPVTIRRNRRAAERTGLESDELSQAQKASAKGPVPTDPRLLRAARDLCADRVAMLERRRVWRGGTQIVIALIVVAAAVAWSWWFLLPGGIVLGMGAYLVFLPRLVRRRLAVLDGALIRTGPQPSTETAQQTSARNSDQVSPYEPT
ncbi:hypothetical protein GCM10022223_54080 [Kineosporia mesophila]|uniref:Integral membrane protein n=1 Tax=Kineosporia mesophila TaxID=566012 RepID=A0ABP7ADA7_9ACTN|nr:hypothetical protein [Kineosporia mesophila]MCD5351214.1 hypothetical protein [Kineosporia mesophila]